MKKILILSAILLVLTACKTVALPTTPTLTPTAVPTVEVTVETATQTPESIACLSTFETREIKTTGKPRVALSADEWNGYLDLMGIQSLCIPVELGTPFVNADWDSAKMPATGRMASIGFENSYHGSGWSDIFLVYATYDFKTGTEFDRFASLEDRDGLLDHTIPNEIVVNGVSGFSRFKTSMWTYEGSPDIIYKTAVFPFEDDYVAVVYRMGFFENGKEVIAKLEAGEYPTGNDNQSGWMDYLVNSLQFKTKP